jgi:hypothetical protein
MLDNIFFPFYVPSSFPNLPLVILHDTHVHIFDAPHVPHEETSVWGKLGRMLQHILLRHILPLSAAFGFQFTDVLAYLGRHASLNSEITSGEDIHALEPEAGKHLNGPSTKPTNGNELFHDLFVTGFHEHSSAQLSGREFFSKALNVLCLSL